LRVLIADDHESVRRGIHRLLSSRSGWSFSEAVDGQDAIEKAKDFHPDLVLMDASMPRMDGLEATKVIRREIPNCKVIIVTQNEAAVARQQALSAGAHGFVSKSNLAKDLFPEISKLELKAGDSARDARPSPAKLDSAELIPAEFSSAKPTSAEIHSDDKLFDDPSEMAALMRAHDWTSTPLGSTETWSMALRMMVRFMLPNPFPQLLWWGPQLCCLYNDAYVPVLGTKHPWALGRPTEEVWREVWHVLRPLVAAPFHGGPATWVEDIPLELNRSGFMEETHFTIAYSPIKDDSVPSGIGGVLATVHEISQKVVGERRVVVLKDLGARSAEPKSAEEACIIAAETLGRHSKDIPFTLLYLIDEKRTRAYFAAGSGIDADDRKFPRTVVFEQSKTKEAWPFTAAMESEGIQIVSDLSNRFENVPQGPWTDPPTLAAVVPVRSNIPHQLAGVAVIGISARLQLDEGYRNFLDLVSTQISISIANARAYEEERKRAEALAEIDRAKTTFFSNVSHEFRTPLTLMLGPIQDLLSRSQTHLTPTATQHLEMVNRNGARLLRLVNTLLDFSRIEAGRVKAVYLATDLAAFTAELAGVFRSATERAGLRLEVDCHQTKEIAYVDRDMWEKIVLNLISNAFKFTFEGEISTSLTQVGHVAELRIRDTGVGIPAEEIPRLFDRFHRVPNTRSRTHEGSGIGLALVHELVKLHSGSMRVESALGQGSTFIVTIPLGQDHLAREQIGGERTLASTATGANPFVQEALRWLPDANDANIDELPRAEEWMSVPCPPDSTAANRLRVLVADDNADMRQYLTRLLAERYEVISAADGQAALDSVRERAPHLVLTDVMMPNLDGFGLLRAMRSDASTNTIPIILLSARAGEESRVEGLDAGADDYLIKPFSARELLARVQTHLELARVRNEANKIIYESEERLRAFVTASSDVVYRMSPDWSRMYQLQGKDFIADTKDPSETWLRKYIHPEDQAKVLAVIDDAIRNKSIFQLEHRVVRADDSLGWTFSRAIPLLNDEGEIVEWFGAASDITARKKAEEELREAQANLESRVKRRTEELEIAQTDLRDLSAKLLQLQDEERRRIASELHDSAGQILAVLSLKLAELSLAADKFDGELASKAEEAQDLVQRLTREIRTTSYLLHPPLLDENGIATALRLYIEGLAARTQLKIELKIDEKFARLPREIELTMFRIVQEGLTNVLRHSQSKDVEIRIHRTDYKVALEVQDHGTGIPSARLAELNDGGSGVGMRGMRYRVRQLNGEMDIFSGKTGTTISISLPVQNQKDSVSGGGRRPVESIRAIS
jgi:signal transduction histidine kinase